MSDAALGKKAQNSAGPMVLRSPAMTTVAPLSSGSSNWPMETSKPTEMAARTRSPGPMDHGKRGGQKRD